MTQEDKIKSLVKANQSARQIADALGLNEMVVRRKIKAAGLELAKGTRFIPQLTNNSYKLRATLGFILVQLWEKFHDYEPISEITGLNRQEINRAKSRPFDHDWRLSQIERTLAYDEKQLKEVIYEASR